MTTRPNVLVILSDQHQFRKTGCYGHPLVQTPNLDRLAQQGTVFDRAFCSNPLCVPSRVSMLTGRYSRHNGVYSLGATFADDIPTYAHLFAGAGYDTVIAGRIHLVWNDDKHGFEKRLNEEPYTNILNTREWWHDEVPHGKNTAGFDDLKPGFGYRPYVTDSKGLASALDYLRNAAPAQGRPWMITANFYQPHTPFTCPEEFWNLYEGQDLDVPNVEEEYEKGCRDRMYETTRRWWGVDAARPTRSGVHKALTGYYGSITCMDRMIGELLRTLEETDQLENTIVVYTSDHGEMLGAKGLWFKSSLYCESAQVPFIVSAPGRFTGGRRVTAPVSHTDLFPSLAELLGVDLHPDLAIDGRSILPLLQGNEDRDEWDRRGVLSEYADYGVRTPMATWVRGSYKLTEADGYDPVLINLDTDPQEEDNLAASPNHSGVLAEMSRELHAVWDPAEVRRIVLDRQFGFRLVEKAHEMQGLL